MRRTLILALLLIAPFTHAQTPHKSLDTLRAEAKALLASETALSKKNICQNPHFSQADLNECFAKEAHRIDASYLHLVRIIGALLREEAVEDRSANAPPSPIPHLFNTAESAWQDYREKACTAAANEYDGGSMQPMQFAGCYTNLTSSHIKELADLYADDIFPR